MRATRMLIPTLKETPQDAEVVSHQLMVRAGMIRKVAAGIYTLLPMGLRVLRKVEAIVREEMVRAGAEEVMMPMVIPSNLWEESGRWDQYGSELLRIKDRHGRNFCLGPTHEEVITTLVKGDVKSYKELPVNLFQIQSKFRDEIRPRFGLMRGREFVMKDAYSFHSTDECADREYQAMYGAYTRIFERCGLDFRPVEADSGSIGGSFSHEFMVLAETGEDAVANCPECNYTANSEKAEVLDIGGEAGHIPSGSEALSEVSTPGVKSIDEVSGFLSIEPSRLIKTLVYETDLGPVVGLVRGDFDLNEVKLKSLVGASVIELASEEVVAEVTGAPSGFAGPVNLPEGPAGEGSEDGVRVFGDYSVGTVVDGVTGANKVDTHLKGVNPGRDFACEYADLRVVVEGDECPRCGPRFSQGGKGGRIKMLRGIEVGHVFKLGTKYSSAMGCEFLDSNGKPQPAIMGCYGIGVGRTAAAAIEQNHDDRGIIWPRALAPFGVSVIALNLKDEETVSTSEGFYKELITGGIDAMIDDRNTRPGSRFADWELLGIPVAIAVGPKSLKEGNVEVKVRSTGERLEVPVGEVIDTVKGFLKG